MEGERVSVFIVGRGAVASGLAGVVVLGWAGLHKGAISGVGGEGEQGGGGWGDGSYWWVLAFGGSTVTGLALEDGAILQLVVQGEGFRVGDRASGEDAEVWAVGVVDDSGNAVGVTRVVDEPCDSSLGLSVDVE